MSPTEADEATHDDTEPDDEELSEQDEQDIERLDIALTTLDDESLRRGLSGITEKQRQDLATQLNLPRATVHLGDALAPLVRRKLHGLSVDRQHTIATALTNRANEDRKSTRLNSSHSQISYAVFCLKKKKKQTYITATTSCSSSH